MRIPILCQKPKYRIEATVGPSGTWFWRAVSVANGQTVATSETYSSYSACFDTAIAVARNADWPCVVVGPEKPV